MESLNKPIIDSEGNLTEVGNLIADNRTLDLDAWLDSKTFLLTSPERLILIGEKIRDGIALTKAEQKYIERFHKREQKKLPASPSSQLPLSCETLALTVLPL